MRVQTNSVFPALQKAKSRRVFYVGFKEFAHFLIFWIYRKNKDETNDKINRSRY